MKNLKRLVSVLFSVILLFSATTTSSIAIDKLHFVIGDYGAIAVAKNSPYKNFKDVVDAYKKDPSSVKMAGGSVR